MKLYFAYGANLNIDSMAYRCPDAVQVQPMVLRDWRLLFSGVATIVPEIGSMVPGALWAISDEDEQALDQFEGWPMLYRKEVLICDGLEFMVYVMNSDAPAEPSVNYVMTIAQGYQDWGLDLEDLSEAVMRTQQEVYDYDMQWSASDISRFTDIDRNLAHDLSLESGHDLRWLRDHGLADPDIETVQ